MGRSKILIIGPAWVGDMVISQSLLKLLRRQEPEAAIDVVAPSWSGPLLTRMPEVRRTIALDIGHGELGLVRRWQLGRALRGERYDRAIVLPRSLKAALVPFIADVPHRTGFRGELRYGLLNDVRSLDKGRLDQTVKRFLALGLSSEAPLPEPPAPALTVDRDNLWSLRRELRLSDSAKVVALMPGAAYGPAKCWPIEYFGELADRLGAAGVEAWILGSAADAGAGEEIRRIANGALNLCGKTRLEDTVDLLSVARAAVTNDSGLMHVAAAAGTHVLALYGSTSPDFTPPLTTARTVHYLSLDCSPCFRRKCPLGHLRCLREIKPETVFSSVIQTI